jgi:eukaryotic-like serine/threonine-protein kinase
MRHEPCGTPWPARTGRSVLASVCVKPRAPNVLVDRYRIDGLLARGGMADLWAGRDLREDRPVAVKVLRVWAADRTDAVERFEREAQLLRRIDHPSVCRLLDAGRTPEDAPFLVLELLEGETLERRLEREQFLPFLELGTLLTLVLDGLAAVHAAGIIHRDLKPSNLFIAREAAGLERPVILDFGVSRLKLTALQSSEGPMLTSDQALLGSLPYMAPEQIDSAAHVDERADIYAVGAIMFRALSGRAPFEGLPPAALIELKRAAQPPSISRVTGDRWPAGIERFLCKALALDPDRRFESATEACERLQAVLHGKHEARLGRKRLKRPPGVTGSSDEPTRTVTFHAQRGDLAPRRKPGRG